MDSPGLPRSHFYSRIAHGLHQIIDRKIPQEDRTPRMVTNRVDIQEAASQIAWCPVCREELNVDDDNPFSSWCSCGDFHVKAVWKNGDVEFVFILNAPKEEASGSSSGESEVEPPG